MTYNEDYDAQEDARKAAERGATAERAGHPGARSLQDKATIDAGLSHDKVAGMDLGASPLGTDAEAGGSSAGVSAPPPTAGVEGGAARDPNRANAVRPPVPWIWIVLAVLAAVLLGAVLLSSLT